MKEYLSCVKKWLECHYIKFIMTFERMIARESKIGQPIKQILVVRLDEIGDMVLTTPFFRELRRNYPEAEITLVVKPAIYNLMELCPYIDN